MINPDGSKYEGDWDKGKFHGKGKLYNIRGEIIEGEWKAGIFMD